MKPGAGPVTATRSIKKELKNILDENRDKEYLKNHEHAGAIKTKSLNGKALPVMMFSSPKKVNVRRTAVRPIKKSGSVVEDQEGLLGEDWEKKAYVAPSIAAAKDCDNSMQLTPTYHRSRIALLPAISMPIIRMTCAEGM